MWSGEDGSSEADEVSEVGSSKADEGRLPARRLIGWWCEEIPARRLLRNWILIELYTVILMKPSETIYLFHSSKSKVIREEKHRKQGILSVRSDILPTVTLGKKMADYGWKWKYFENQSASCVMTKLDLRFLTNSRKDGTLDWTKCHETDLYLLKPNKFLKISYATQLIENLRKKINCGNFSHIISVVWGLCMVLWSMQDNRISVTLMAVLSYGEAVAQRTTSRWEHSWIVPYNVK